MRPAFAFCEEHSPAPCGRQLHNSFDLRLRALHPIPVNLCDGIKKKRLLGAFRCRQPLSIRA